MQYSNIEPKTSLKFQLTAVKAVLLVRKNNIGDQKLKFS